MRCKEFENRIIDYLEANLPEAEQQRMHEHCRSCDRCSRLYENIRKTYGVLEEDRAPEIDDAFFVDITEKLDEKRRPDGKVLSLNHLFAAAASVAVLVSLAMGFLLTQKASQPKQDVAQDEHTYYMDSIGSDFYLNRQTASLETYLKEAE